MRVQICAVGRLRAGAEQSLVDTYRERFDFIGRQIGLGPLTISEVEAKKGSGKSAEANLLSKAATSGAVVCALDERGSTLSSPEFAHLLAKWRDQGRSGATFLIGGADGLDAGLIASADTTLSMGKMVWPHMLARIMLTEQIYRAASILANKPYHRT